MSLPRYQYTGPVDHTVVPDREKIRGKSVIITGGANGMGEVCVRDFAAAGAFVTFADLNEERGKAIEAELNANGVCSVFVKCDIRDWDQQIAMFETAKSKSPHNSVDVVIANAGISRSSGDSLWNLDDPNGEPTKPNLNIVRDRDRCFIMTGSMVSYIDSPGNWEYTATKHGLRGFMKTARRSSWEQGIRINYVAPCWIKSAIRTAEYEKWLVDRGVEFGEQIDVAGCMMRISTDRSINVEQPLFHDHPRSIAKEGFMDVNREDYFDTPEDAYMKRTQESQLVIIEDKWRDDYKVRVYKKD
ncbi:unnamed protein product [Parascedosporium putredinis]|uniref:Uncharacterized protein n=1 Tax=Parascedosporium putredinis TaxID=1442378 RepID=A0A9P1M7M7_9PEZI|nr:unnamed protein product [Parascedosporium putredinis]CAI7990770.1 unnamed protein product [Parascedosporium putredinis]